MKRKSIKPVTIQIHHNPYALSTKVRINGRSVAKRNALHAIPEHGHLQEWINLLPELLRKQYPRRKYRFVFEGTRADFDDLVEILQTTINKKIRRAVCRHVPAQEPQDKIIQIHRLLAVLTDPACPVPALASPDVIAAFEHAKSDEFEVCVVATMSSGKSTLINALLGSRLMPSRQDACTAIVTRIRDEDALGESGFRGQAFDAQGKLVKPMVALTAEKMAELNDNPSVTTLEVEGDIPFVVSEKLSLVLVDTPGPNNARNQCHRVVQRAFLNKSSKAVILYVMTGQFGTDDDHALLDRITRSMSVGGKQSRDRFIFVVNKMDCYKKEDGDPAQTLQTIRSYLEGHGVVNPSIFPVAALPALNIRCELAGMGLDEDDADETAIAIRKLNRTPEMHLESYARRFTSLPALTIDELEAQCRAFAEAWQARGGKPGADPREALIHSGLPTLEAAIRVYMEKYAYPAKIRTIAETLAHRLEEVEAEAATKPLDATGLEFLKLVRHQLEDLLKIHPEEKPEWRLSVPHVERGVATAVTARNGATHEETADATASTKIVIDDTVAERQNEGSGWDGRGRQDGGEEWNEPREWGSIAARAREDGMHEVAIKYNPYMVETAITIDGQEPAGNSWFQANSRKRLQEWVDELPQRLVEELNDAEFLIKFHGTTPDLEDVRDSLEFAAKTLPDFHYRLEHTPAKEEEEGVSKEEKIREVFAKIQSIRENAELAEDFEKLTSPDVVDAFNTALNNEFEVFVVATMSAGKSTLINAMLGRKLMPSKQEACTALITRIKDSDSDEPDAPFSAEAYDSLDGGEKLETITRLRLADMERLNGREDVRRIEVTGDIPFVASDEVALVLIDTPGPNNSRTKDHEKVQRDMLDNKAKPLILYVMTGEFGTDDDKNVLNRVAESMVSGGKQARDRFLFVVNKLDGRKKEDGDLGEFLESVKKHLEENGIKDPNIFPAGALPAMNIRLLGQNALDDEDEIEDTEGKIRKFNRTTRYHFEKAAPLPRRVQAEIDGELRRTQAEWSGPDLENPAEALIHTGVPSVEAAIRLYVEKYARTAKIKTLVDTFMGRLDSLGKLTDLEAAIAENKENGERILGEINTVREKAAQMRDAKSFENRVDQAVEAVVAESAERTDILMGKIYAKIASKYGARADDTIELDEVDDEVRSMQRFANRLQDQFKEELDTLIQEQLVTTGEHLVEEYKKKLTELGSGIELSSAALNFKPLELMAGDLDDQVLSRAAIKSLEREEQVKSGEEWVENTNKKWWKPWTWGEEKGYWRTTYKTHHFIRVSELAITYFEPIQQAMHENAKEAKNFAQEQSQNISNYFKGVFAKLDQQLQGMMDNLEKLATNQKNNEEELKRIQRKKAWIEDIQTEIKAILEI